MRWAYKFAYVGSGFHGYHRQPGLRTVEGDILEVLMTEGIIDDPHTSRFQSASRTDKYVSALGNVAAFNSSLDPRKTASILNAFLTDIWFYAYSQVPITFNPRAALERWYRYHFPGASVPESLEETAYLFLGKHDFRAFSKGGVPGTCEVRDVRLRTTGEWTIFDVRADRFLWNMVRRLCGCLEMVAEGALTRRDVEKALKGGSLPPRLAPPEYLWLMDVSYSFPFEPLNLPKVKMKAMLERNRKDVQAKYFEELARRCSDSTISQP